LIKLQNENIQCFLFDEFTVLTNPFVSNAIGGVKIKVRSQDMQKALKILESINFDNSGKKSPPAVENDLAAVAFQMKGQFGQMAQGHAHICLAFGWAIE